MIRIGQDDVLIVGQHGRLLLTVRVRYWYKNPHGERGPKYLMRNEIRSKGSSGLPFDQSLEMVFWNALNIGHGGQVPVGS